MPRWSPPHRPNRRHGADQQQAAVLEITEQAHQAAGRASAFANLRRSILAILGFLLLHLTVINVSIDLAACHQLVMRADSRIDAPRRGRRMRSQLRIDAMRWAMMIFVVPGRASRRPRRMCSSIGHVDRAGRVVEDQNFRLLDDRAGNAQALPLPAGDSRRSCSSSVS